MVAWRIRPACSTHPRASTLIATWWAPSSTLHRSFAANVATIDSSVLCVPCVSSAARPTSWRWVWPAAAVRRHVLVCWSWIRSNCLDDPTRVNQCWRNHALVIEPLKFWVSKFKIFNFFASLFVLKNKYRKAIWSDTVCEAFTNSALMDSLTLRFKSSSSSSLTEQEKQINKIQVLNNENKKPVANAASYIGRANFSARRRQFCRLWKHLRFDARFNGAKQLCWRLFRSKY